MLYLKKREWIVVQRTGGQTLSGMAQGQTPDNEVLTHTRPYTAYSYRHEEQFGYETGHQHKHHER